MVGEVGQARQGDRELSQGDMEFRMGFYHDLGRPAVQTRGDV